MIALVDYVQTLIFCHVQVMAKSRIGHLVEAQILQAIGVDYIDE